jgi:hypothetical protein
MNDAHVSTTLMMCDITSLHSIAMEGDVTLLDAKLDQMRSNGSLDSVVISQKDSSELTPLHYAIKYKHFGVAKTLIESGANLAARDKYGWTPLHYVAKYYFTPGSGVNNVDDEAFPDIPEDYESVIMNETNGEDVNSVKQLLLEVPEVTTLPNTIQVHIYICIGGNHNSPPPPGPP